LSPARPGLSLLEMMVATTIMATLMASVVVVMRSGYAVWNAEQADIDALENAYAVLRHFVQQMRQADSVTAISAPSDTSGDLSFLTATGATRSWTHNGAPKEIYFDNGAGSGLLANGIDTLTFTGYEADGVTETTVVNDIQVVECAVQVTLPQGAGVTRTVSCHAWIRSW
jgi:prepilin-type N-terminal cleavage/methylation domain-containing protein